MRAMRLSVLLGAMVLFGGCAPYYEEVPAFGESDPNQIAAQDRLQVQQQAQPQQQVAYDNQAQQAIDPGQPVNQDQDFADTDPSALSEFKSTLDPYGTWADDSQYGTVWQPDSNVVGADFAPYVTGGHWGYDDDYVWVSDYDWGWAPFHYGRWVYIAGRGWCWIPGRRYAGAWVSWRVGADGYDYIGWGPMAPSWYWRDGYAYDIGWGVSTPYTFCHTRDLFSPSLHGRVLAGPEVSTVANNTHAYNEGRTPARPVVGPPLGRLGVNAPPFERSPGYLRAVTLAHHPGVAQIRPSATQPTHVPYFRPGMPNNDHPVVTAPRFNGVPPQTYHGPVYRPYTGAPARTEPFGAAPYRGYSAMPPTFRGAPPVYHNAPPVQQMSPPPVYRGGGGGGFGGGGGGYHPPSTSTYTHSHSYSHSSGGGGGRHR